MIKTIEGLVRSFSKLREEYSINKMLLQTYKTVSNMRYMMRIMLSIASSLNVLRSNGWQDYR